MTAMILPQPAHWLQVCALIVLALAAIITASATKPGHLPPPSLKQLAAAHQLEIGVYLSRQIMKEPAYQTIASRQFNLAVADGQPNWHYEDGSLRPGPAGFDFSRLDEVVEFARQQGLKVRAHHLVWGEEKWLPEWLKNGGYSPTQLLGLLENHIKSVVGRYKGQVKQWTVVNEVFSRGLGEKGLSDWWGQRLGTAYLDQAFQWAKQADPEAVLLVNDFNNETKNPVSDAIYDYVAGALRRGVPIDGVGFQMHINGAAPPAKQSVIDNMERFGRLGLKIYVTEFDVNLNDIATGSQRQKFDRQKQVYRDMLSACLASEHCVSFSLLGITDKESWYNDLGIPNAQPLPFDNNYRAKPAFFGLREALRAGRPKTGVVTNFTALTGLPMPHWYGYEQ